MNMEDIDGLKELIMPFEFTGYPIEEKGYPIEEKTDE